MSMTPPAPTTLTSFRKIQDGADTIPRRRGSNEIEITNGGEREAKEDSTRGNESVEVVGASRVALVSEDCGEESPKEWWGARHTLALMGFLGFTVLSTVRVCLSITIVAMVKSEAKNSTDRNASFDTCPFPDDYHVAETNRNEAGEFAWDEATQGRILSSFFYGYISTNLIAGRAAEHLGGKLVFGLGYSVSGLLTVLSPWLARRSTEALVVARVLVGAGVGVSFPAMTTLLASWIPPDERGKFVTLVYNGIDFGNVLALVVSGWLCDVDILGGWPLVFYIFGALALVWTFVWLLIISDLPEKHPRISAAEKAYVMQRCGVTREKPLPIPWRAIMTSLPVWAIMVVQTGNNWGFFTLLTEMPTYLKNVLHFDMRSVSCREKQANAQPDSVEKESRKRDETEV
ncbi:sialin-like [Penaeus indicus]|uniref:sialin-like n=1 Tax=Penaeus indicus TaxID=29960 RepID=UPI00300C1483